MLRLSLIGTLKNLFLSLTNAKAINENDHNFGVNYWLMLNN